MANLASLKAVAQANLAAAQAVQAQLASHIEQLQSTVTEMDQAASGSTTVADLQSLQATVTKLLADAQS